MTVKNLNQGDREFDTICGFYHPRISLIYFSFHARSSFISTPFSKKRDGDGLKLNSKHTLYFRLIFVL